MGCLLICGIERISKALSKGFIGVGLGGEELPETGHIGDGVEDSDGVKFLGWESPEVAEAEPTLGDVVPTGFGELLVALLDAAPDLVAAREFVDFFTSPPHPVPPVVGGGVD